MTYLDDPEHSWELDPLEPDPLYDLVDELAATTAENQELILLGFAGLRMRHPEASVEQCLQTSIIWCFG